MISKQPCPSTGCRTQTGIKGKEGMLLRKHEGIGGGQGVLLPNTPHCEITNWTVKTLAKQKYRGAAGSKIIPARQLTNFYLCVNSGHKYILQQVVGKVRLIILLRRGSASKTKLLNAKVEGRGETVMCCPPSETAAAVPSSWISPSLDSDLTSFMEIQRWTLHTVTKLRATQLAGRQGHKTK